MENKNMSLNRRITDEVRAQIAFEVFRTTEANRKNFRNGSYTKIGAKFGCSRVTVCNIAKEFNVDRGCEPAEHLVPGYKGPKGEGSQNQDVSTINWTFDSELKLKRVKRKETALVEQVHDSMSALAKLS